MTNTKQIDTSKILLQDIEELPIIIRNILKRKLGLKTLEELLDTDYETLRRARGMGELNLHRLIEYIHSLGYQVKGEEESLSKILEKLKEEGKTVLQDIIPEAKIYQPLYRQNIYTLEDLIAYADKLQKLEGIGRTKYQKLLDILKSLGIEVVEQTKEVKETPLEIAINQYATSNQLIRDRLSKKRQQLEEYKQLIAERETLLLEEQELDSQISKIQQEISETHVKKLSNN